MNRYSYSRVPSFIHTLQQPPSAIAEIGGSPADPDIHGSVRFYQTGAGVLVAAQISGLPTAASPCRARFFAFHIHSGSSCTGDPGDPFANAGGHYDPGACPHPGHAGDLPPLLGNDGSAFAVFLTGRFTVSEVIGMTVIIHENPDDFSTQPAGNAGRKIACGVIEPFPSPRHPHGY